MKVLGFAFTKMNANRQNKFDIRCNKSINIDFSEIVKEGAIDLVKSDAIYTISFGYTVAYLEPGTKKENKQAEIVLEGILTISLDKNEDKDFSKTYKKKEMNNKLKEVLFNFLLRKCTPRAIDLEDQLNLPSHIAIPQVRLENAKDTEKQSK